MNSCYFALYRAYFNLFNSSNDGKFFWSWIQKDDIEVQEKKKKVVVLCSRPWQKMKLCTFTLQSCSDSKEISYCLANLNLLLFHCSLLLPLRKLPNNLILGQPEWCINFQWIWTNFSHQNGTYTGFSIRASSWWNSPAISHELTTYFSLEVTPVFSNNMI